MLLIATIQTTFVKKPVFLSSSPLARSVVLDFAVIHVALIMVDTEISCNGDLQAVNHPMATTMCGL